MSVCLIQVPYMVGDERHPAAAGPEAVVQRALPLLADHGIEARTELVDRGEPFRDSVSASRAVNTRLADTVRRVLGRGELPLAVAGSCDASMGVVGGFAHERSGVVWLDAHADFNTPESTASGFFGGMSLAVLTGGCYRSLWAQVGDSRPVAEEAVVLVGVRDLSPDAERERLERSAIRIAPPGDGLDAALDRLAGNVRDVYLHVDLDALDPEIAPGIVDDPVPGGLTLEELEGTIQAVMTRFRITAASLTTFVPTRDRDHRTLRVVLRAIELLAAAGVSAPVRD